MKMQKESFRAYRLDEERENDKSIVITVRLNDKEQEILKSLKHTLNIHMDSTVLKICMKLSKNVIHGTLGADNLRYLTDRSRRRELIE